MSLADEPPLRDLPDRIIRQTLQHPAHLRAFLEQVVPHLAARFGYDRARLAERLFPLEDWREREADLPFEIPFRLAGDAEIWALVLVLIEHQSATERLMPLRTLLYAALYWDRQWSAWRRLPQPRPTLRLHPVLPVVLYTGGRPWGSTRTLLELLGEPTEFHAFAPHWEPLLWNLADRTPEALLAAQSEWLKALAVFRAEEAETEAFRAVFAQAVRDIAPLAVGDPVRWNDLMRMLLTWAFWRRPEQERAALVAEAVARQADDPFRKEIQTMSNKLGPTLVELSIAKGREQGNREGQLQDARALLRILIEDRFGAAPAALAQRIEEIDDLERLHTAVRRVHKVQTVDELLLQGSGLGPPAQSVLRERLPGPVRPLRQGDAARPRLPALRGRLRVVRRRQGLAGGSPLPRRPGRSAPAPASGQVGDFPRGGRHSLSGVPRLPRLPAAAAGEPELDMEVGLLDGWVRFWYRGRLLPLPADLQRDLDETQMQAAMEKRRADDQQQRADGLQQQTDDLQRQLQEAKEARQAAERELAQLRRQLHHR